MSSGPVAVGDQLGRWLITAAMEADGASTAQLFRGEAEGVQAVLKVLRIGRINGRSDPNHSPLEPP